MNAFLSLTDPRVAIYSLDLSGWFEISGRYGFSRPGAMVFGTHAAISFPSLVLGQGNCGIGIDDKAEQVHWHPRADRH